MIPFIKATAIPMGNSVFITWPQIDAMFANYASAYFGSHARAEGARDENDCYLELTGLKPDDYEKFSLLFSRYDADGEYDPVEEFCIGHGTYISLPNCITRGVLSEILPSEFGLKCIGCLQAMHEGVFMTENRLDYDQFVIGRSEIETPVQPLPAEKYFEIFVEDPRGQFDYSVFVVGVLNANEAVEKAVADCLFAEPEHIGMIDSVEEISREEFLSATGRQFNTKATLAEQILSAQERQGREEDMGPVIDQDRSR